MMNVSKPKRPVYNPFEELGRIPKTAVEQVGGVRSGISSPPASAQDRSDVSEVPEEIVEAQHRARLKKLREEVGQIRQQRREKEKGERRQEEIVGLQQKVGNQEPAVEPSTKRPRGILAGMAGVVKKLQSRVETGSRKQQ